MNKLPKLGPSYLDGWNGKPPVIVTFIVKENKSIGNKENGKTRSTALTGRKAAGDQEYRAQHRAQHVLPVLLSLTWHQRMNTSVTFPS